MFYFKGSFSVFIICKLYLFKNYYFSSCSFSQTLTFNQSFCIHKKPEPRSGFQVYSVVSSFPVLARLLDNRAVSRRTRGLWCGWWLLRHKRFRRSVRLYHDECQVLRWRLAQAQHLLLPPPENRDLIKNEFSA